MSTQSPFGSETTPLKPEWLPDTDGVRCRKRRTGRGIWDTLLYPGEPPIPGTHAIEAVEIVYPALDLDMFGWSVNWLAAFLVLSLTFGFAFKDLLGIEI